jgi:hypothetical protein
VTEETSAELLLIAASGWTIQLILFEEKIILVWVQCGLTNLTIFKKYSKYVSYPKLTVLFLRLKSLQSLGLEITT